MTTSSLESEEAMSSSSLHSVRSVNAQDVCAHFNISATQTPTVASVLGENAESSRRGPRGNAFGGRQAELGSGVTEPDGGDPRQYYARIHPIDAARAQVYLECTADNDTAWSSDSEPCSFGPDADADSYRFNPFTDAESSSEKDTFDTASTPSPTSSDGYVTASCETLTQGSSQDWASDGRTEDEYSVLETTELDTFAAPNSELISLPIVLAQPGQRQCLTDEIGSVASECVELSMFSDFFHDDNGSRATQNGNLSAEQCTIDTVGLHEDLAWHDRPRPDETETKGPKALLHHRRSACMARAMRENDRRRVQSMSDPELHTRPASFLTPSQIEALKVSYGSPTARTQYTTPRGRQNDIRRSECMSRWFGMAHSGRLGMRRRMFHRQNSGRTASDGSENACMDLRALLGRATAKSNP